MKLTNILPLLPVICLLSSCAQPEIGVPQSDQQLISTKQTEAPKNFVVYPDDRPSIPDGKLVYDKQNCASCHGATGAGGSGPALNDKLKEAQVKPVDMYKALTYGEQDYHHMQGKLSNRDTWNLVFYTRSLACPALTQAQVDEILPVFGSNCAVCHGTKGDGDGPLARNLEPNPANFQTMRRFYDRTDDTLFDHIANGIKWEGMPNFLGKEDKKKNVKFDHEYIRKLVAFIRNFHVSNEPTNPALVAATANNAPAGAPATGNSAAPAGENKQPAAESKSETTAAPAATGEGDKSKPAEGETKPGAESKTSTESKTGAESKTPTESTIPAETTPSEKNRQSGGQSH